SSGRCVDRWSPRDSARIRKEVGAMSMSNRYANLYEEMLESVATSRPRRPWPPLACFWPMSGESYSPGPRVLLVGRATNGWDPKTKHLALSHPAERHRIAQQSRE